MTDDPDTDALPRIVDAIARAALTTAALNCEHSAGAAGTPAARLYSAVRERIVTQLLAELHFTVKPGMRDAMMARIETNAEVIRAALEQDYRAASGERVH